MGVLMSFLINNFPRYRASEIRNHIVSLLESENATMTLCLRCFLSGDQWRHCRGTWRHSRWRHQTRSNNTLLSARCHVYPRFRDRTPRKWCCSLASDQHDRMNILNYTDATYKNTVWTVFICVKNDK